MIARDLLSFSEGCQRLYAPGLSRENYTSRGIRFVRHLISAEFGGCGVFNRRSGRLSIGFDVPHTSFGSAMNAYAALMGDYPLFNFDPAVNQGRPFRRSQFFSARSFRRLDIYNEVYRPLGIDNHCALHVPTNDHEALFFFLERKGGPDFSERDMQVLEVAQSHLHTAYALSHATVADQTHPVRPESLVKAGLTPREADTLAWICQGKSNAETAIILGISVYTVKDHLTSIFNKTGASNRLAAILWAQRVCQRTDEDTTLFTETETHLTVSGSPSEVG